MRKAKIMLALQKYLDKHNIDYFSNYYLDTKYYQVHLDIYLPGPRCGIQIEIKHKHHWFESKKKQAKRVAISNERTKYCKQHAIDIIYCDGTNYKQVNSKINDELHPYANY